MNEDSERTIPIPEAPIEKIPEKPAEKKNEEIGMPKEQKDVPEKGLEEVQKQAPQPLTKENVRKDAKSWLNEMGWSGSPFTFTILPELFVGYNEQTQNVCTMLDEKHKIILLVGPTGSGKTTLLKWVSERLPDGFDFIFIGKPPEKPEEFVDIFNEKFKRPWYLRWLMPNIKNIHQIPNMLNKRLKDKHIVVMLDEAHESNLDILEWLRVLSDQVNNMSVLIAGLPVFDEKLSELETLRKRVVAKIELISLTKEETIELIRKRIESVGGSGIKPFDNNAIDKIYERTGGFPREVIRICNELVNKAIVQYRFEILPDVLFVDKREEPKKVSLDILDRMTPMQKSILETLAKGSYTPGDIANMLNLEKYKSRQHAVRSVNNIMKRLLADGFIERRKRDKAFVYSLAPQLKTILVKA